MCGLDVCVHVCVYMSMYMCVCMCVFNKSVLMCVHCMCATSQVRRVAMEKCEYHSPPLSPRSLAGPQILM